jgi:antirestriction protein
MSDPVTHYTHDGYIQCTQCEGSGKDVEVSAEWTCHHCNGTGRRLPKTTDVVLLLLAVLDKLEKVEDRVERGFAPPHLI